MSVETVPNNLRNLRSCLLCSLVKKPDVTYRASVMTSAYIIVMETSGAIRKVAREYNITESTLRNQIRGHVDPDTTRSGPEPIFSQEEETFEQFELDGCDNCDEFLHLKNNTDAVYDCTSSNFDGIIATMGPEDSWVCKWQRIERFTKGCYAISVTGRLPPGRVRDLKRKGIVYRARDVAQKS